MGTTLIAYATKTGTTQEIAQYAAEYLTETGVESVALPIAEVRSLDDYSAVVVGAPINGMRWVPEAVSFVTKHREALRTRPVALFALSYMHDHGRPLWRRAIEKSVSASAEVAGATTVAIFGGRINTPLPGFARFLFGIPKDLPLDTRNREAIREWIHSLPWALKTKE